MDQNSNCIFEPKRFEMARVYFSLGSNQGDRMHSLVQATKHIENLIGKLISYSAVFESEPWGFNAETTFYNQVLLVETDLSPKKVLKTILNIEKTIGRIRSGTTYISRIIDIDILFYNTEIINSENLVIPHPMLHLRRFVLEPLATIAPDLIHPGYNTTISILLRQLNDKCLIKIFAEKDTFAGLLNTLNQR